MQRDSKCIYLTELSDHLLDFTGELLAGALDDDLVLTGELLRAALLLVNDLEVLGAVGSNSPAFAARLGWRFCMSGLPLYAYCLASCALSIRVTVEAFDF